MPRISFFCKVETTVSPEHTGSEGRRALPSRHRPRVRALVPRPCAWFGVSACSLPLYATAKCASCLARMLKYSFCLLRQPFKPGTPTGAEFILPVTPLARARAEGVLCFHSGPCIFLLPQNSSTRTGERFRSSAQPPQPLCHCTAPRMPSPHPHLGGDISQSRVRTVPCPQPRSTGQPRPWGVFLDEGFPGGHGGRSSTPQSSRCRVSSPGSWFVPG